MKKLFLTFLILLMASTSYGASQWDKLEPLGTRNVSDLDVYLPTNNEAQDRMLSNYRDGVEVFYASTSTITVSAGEIAIPNAAGSVIRYRKNTTATTVAWTAYTGLEAESTQYYLYGVADTDATTFTVIISANSTTPQDGETYYKRIGSFYNNSSSNIDMTKVYNQPYRPSPTDSSGTPIITAIYNFGTSTSSFTSKYSDLKFAYGYKSLAAAASHTITTLPFTSSTTYITQVSYGTSTGIADSPGITQTSGSALSVKNNASGTQTVNWIAIGY